MMNYIFKCVIVGDSNTGKTCITHNLISQDFKKDSTNTIGVEFDIKTFNLENNSNFSKLKIWTTGGHDRFTNIISAYYDNTTCFVIVYDITDRQSFENVSNWIKKISEKVNIEDKMIFIIGNKIDEKDKREVSYEEGNELAKTYNFIFNELSAKTGENVHFSFKKMIEELNNNVDNLLSKPKNGIEKHLVMKKEKFRTYFCW